MFELGTLWRRTPKFNVATIRDSLAKSLQLDYLVCVQSLEGDRCDLFEGQIEEIAPILEEGDRLDSYHAVLFWLYENGHLNGVKRSLGFSSQGADFARITADDGTVVYEESTLVKRWNGLYNRFRRHVNKSGKLYRDYQTILDVYKIKV